LTATYDKQHSAITAEEHGYYATTNKAKKTVTMVNSKAKPGIVVFGIYNINNYFVN
jgi:hypothetical protein